MISRITSDCSFPLPQEAMRSADIIIRNSAPMRRLLKRIIIKIPRYIYVGKNLTFIVEYPSKG